MSLETLLGHMGKAFLIAIPFLLVYTLVFKEIRKRKARQIMLEALQGELEQLRKQVAVFTAAENPGIKLSKTIGPVSAEGTAGAGFRNVAEKRALVTLMQKALALGADAVIGVHHVGTGMTPMQGRVKLAGTAVKCIRERPINPS